MVKVSIILSETGKSPPANDDTVTVCSFLSVYIHVYTQCTVFIYIQCIPVYTFLYLCTCAFITYIPVYTICESCPGLLQVVLVCPRQAGIHFKNCHGGARQASDPWTVLLRACHQGILITCLARHLALYTQSEP